MSSDKYPVGARLLFKNSKDYGEKLIYGTVVPNFKLPGDICVRWDNLSMVLIPAISSYDPEFLDEYCEVVPAETGN